MQLQDALVHNPGMSDREKSQVQEEINNLTAEKEVLDWKNANPGTPTVESYEAQKSYYDRLWQQNQDAIVNGLGNGTLKQGSDEWYELFKKGDDLLAMKDAYNRGMMGQLDGDKAQTADNKRDRAVEDDQNPEKTNESKALNDLIKTPGYEEDEDNSDATEITIDFTDPEYEQLRSRYSFWKDGNTIAEDLANHIMGNYPAIAEKWGYERLANEIDLHYKLYRLGYRTDRTGTCNISIDNDSSWDLIDAYTRFSKALGKNFELPQ